MPRENSWSACSLALVVTSSLTASSCHQSVEEAWQDLLYSRRMLCFDLRQLGLQSILLKTLSDLNFLGL